MQFGVPQFIDVEDKIFGPLTWKQFLYLAGGAGLSYLFGRILPSGLNFIVVIPTILLSLALTFYKVNEKPFEFVLQAWVSYIFKKKLYVWKQRTNRAGSSKKTEETVAPVPESKLVGSKLKDLAWSLDVLDMKNRGGK